MPRDILKSDLFGITTFNIGGPLAFATLPNAQTSTPMTATPTPAQVRRANPVRGPRYVSTYEEYKKLPSGTEVIWPNGRRWIKPPTSVGGPRYVYMYEEYEELPSGTEVIWPDGMRYTKP